jgi:hypothetical protein
MQLLSRFYRFVLLILFFLLCASNALPLAAQWWPLNRVKEVESQPDGAILVLEDGYLRFQVCANSIAIPDLFRFSFLKLEGAPGTRGIPDAHYRHVVP